MEFQSNKDKRIAIMEAVSDLIDAVEKLTLDRTYENKVIELQITKKFAFLLLDILPDD